MKDKERKKIKFSVDGVDYTLMYTVASLRKMERDGFDFTTMDTHVVNLGYDLFAGAFIAKHNYVPREERDRLYDILVMENEDGKGLIECLAEMLKDELEYITSKPQGNVKWTMA